MKLSIIIPYYKTYDLTVKLFDILIPQLTEETEVILVDDGTFDTRLDKYNSDKVRIIHSEKNSGGCATPRNIGIDNSKGSFIGFIDSDDMVTNNYIDKIIEKINNGVFDYCFISWKSKNGREIIIRDDRPEGNWCVWNCIYKRELIGDKRFNPKELFEDVDFNTRVIEGKRENITDILYIYNENREESLTDLIARGIRTKDNLV
jgi:glycosyltransferase involved in cell wall biosynthesis